MHRALLKSVDVVKYQLRGFSDASNQACSVVIYLGRLVNGLPTISFVLGECTVVQRHQSSGSIARKELVAALNAIKLIKQAMHYIGCINLGNYAKYFRSIIFCCCQMLRIGAFVRLT